MASSGIHKNDVKRGLELSRGFCLQIIHIAALGTPNTYMPLMSADIPRTEYLRMSSSSSTKRQCKKAEHFTLVVGIKNCHKSVIDTDHGQPTTYIVHAPTNDTQ